MEQRPCWQGTPGAAPQAAARCLSAAVAAIIAFALAAAFAAVLLQTVDFPLGTHADETSKVIAVLKHKNNYNHPLLMLHLARGANAAAGLSDPQAVAQLGRALATLAGALAVFATYLLARLALPAPAALAAAAATAVTPLVAMHARHFKEDIFILPLILLGLLALIATLGAPTRRRALLLGIAAGLAASAKYVAIMLGPFAVLVLFIGLAPQVERRERLRLCLIVIVAATATFALVQSPALWDFGRYGPTVLASMNQAEEGARVRVPLALSHGVFNLRESLLPGLGSPLFILGLLGFAAPFIAPRDRRKPLLVIAAFTLLWLAAHELSPLKPYNFERYMVPVAPLFVILGAAFVYELAERLLPEWSGAVAAVTIVVAALPALYVSYRIAGSPEEDLRAMVPQVVLEDRPDAAFDRYTQFNHRRGQIAMHGMPEPARSTILVTSNFVYDRYRVLGTADLQTDEIRGRAARYADLFRRPYLEISNGRPSFAFFNPVLRIVALDGDAAHLTSIAAALRRKYPQVSVTLVKAGASD